MFRSALSVTVIFSSLISLSTRASATCLACPNCILDPLPNGQGNACLNYWTCADGVVTCYYPSVSDPGTFTACAWTVGASDSTFEQAAANPSVCAGSGIGDNSKCEPANNPWNLGTSSCTAAEAYVGEPNSGLL